MNKSYSNKMIMNCYEYDCGDLNEIKRFFMIFGDKQKINYY